MAENKRCAVLDYRGKPIKKFNSISAARDYMNKLQRDYPKDRFRVTENAGSTCLNNVSRTFAASGDRLTHIKKPDVNRRKSKNKAA